MKSLLFPLVLLCLPACFLSSHSTDECGPRPECFGGVEVTSCTRPSTTRCESTSWCDDTIYCEFTSECRPIPATCGRGETLSDLPCRGERGCREVLTCSESYYCRTELCAEPRPFCGDSVEVESCEGWDTCFVADWCGETIYCASNECDTSEMICLPGETLGEPCLFDDGTCRDVSACGRDYGCHIAPDCLDPIFEPCFDATSQLISTGPGFCPDAAWETPCYETNHCGATQYCHTACPQGAEQLDGPHLCDDPNDCYSVDHGRDDLPLFWCQGNGPACRAIPVCDEGMEIPLNSPCPGGAVCDYRSICGSTLQCAVYLDVPG